MMGEAVTKAVTGCDNLAGLIEIVSTRLEYAGKTLLALPERGFSPRLKQKRYDVVRSVAENYWGDVPQMRAPTPSPAEIALMDEAIAWLDFIPDRDQAVRNVVKARMFVHPLNNRYLYSWRRIGREMHLDDKAVQRLYIQGIKKIILGLAQTPQTTL